MSSLEGIDEFFERAPEAIVLVDAECRAVLVNREFVHVFGYSQDVIAGAAVSALIVPPELRDEAESFAASRARGETVNAETVRMHKDGRRLDVSLLEGPLSSSGGTVSGYMIYREISARERLEYELQQQRDRLRLLLDLNNRVASHLDLRELFQAISSELRRIFRCECVGLALPEASGRQLRQHLIDFPEGNGHFQEGTLFPIDGSSAGLAYRSGKAVVLNSLSEVHANWNSESLRAFSRIVLNEGTKSGGFLPLISKDRVLGVLQLISRRERAFAEQDLEFLDQVASQIAITLRNAIEYGEVTASEERTRNENLALREQIVRDSMFEDIVGSSAALSNVLRQVDKVACSDSTVLILGETGTGKELIARAIHKRSRRAARPFIPVNCAAITPSLIASELFGHEKGAFTGATQRRLGRFESANSGTIFLDEVGDLPAEVQIALLRVLQEREIERVGGGKPISLDVRVLAATHRDLNALVREGRFRQDLLYRLNVVPVEMPPLRQRASDIPLLIEYFIDRFGRKSGKKFRTIDKSALRMFQSYAWPGNIRELQNVVERAVILSDDDHFSVDETWLKQQVSPPATATLPLSSALLSQEKEMIEAALQDSHGRISGPSGAAVNLGIPAKTLDSKIKRLGIEAHRFKVSAGLSAPASAE